MIRKIHKKQGFTLVEIMIVVGIITLLAALSVHNLLRAKMTANEAAAIRGLRTLQAAMDSYRLMNPVYPAFDRNPFRKLCSANPPYLDSSWDVDGYQVDRQGYRLEIKLTSEDGQQYLLLALPIQLGVTGNRSFSLSMYPGVEGSGSGEIIDGMGIGLGASSN